MSAEVALSIVINGQTTRLEVAKPPTLLRAIEHLALRADRIAVERNGAIVPRTAWADELLCADDRLEIVHFVGGGTSHSGESAPHITFSAG